ncbi:hypothetical protein ACWV30_001062 [Shigella sonnei]
MDDIDGGEIRELALIALASLEAEPVAECIVEDGGMCIDGFGEYVGHSLPDGMYSAAIFLIPICISFDTAEKHRYATYLILNRRFSFEF